jgi:2'-5' RNA ligase
MSGRSGVIVRIRLPPELEELRQRHDPVAPSGVPAHVTVRFPFLVTSDLTPAVRRRVAGVARQVRPFDVRFERTGRFPNVLWLGPEPSSPFIALTERLAAVFPDHPPYEGAHADIVPHLTLAIGPEAVVERLERKVTRAGVTFRRRVQALEVIAEDAEDRWHARWRLPLGRLGR